MIIVMYNKKTAKIPNEWNEITIEQATKIAELDLPKITDDFDWFQHLEFVNKVVNILTDIETNTVDPVSLVYVFQKYLSKFVFDLNLAAPETFAPEMISNFKHRGVVYLMPTNLEIGETIVLQHGQNTKSFIEASNLLKQFSKLKSEGMKALPLLIASVVKRDRLERFDEVEIARRADDFKDLPMNVAWEVFFCLSLLITKYASGILQSMIVKVKPTLKQRLTIQLGRLRLRKAVLREELKMLIN